MEKNVKNKKTSQNKDVNISATKNGKFNIDKFEIKDRYIIIFFAVITFLFFREIILQQKFLWEDFIYQYYPWRNFAAVSLSNGILPFWNPYTFGGMPFLADIQTAVFYPPHLLLTFFINEENLHFAYLEYSIILHYFMSGVFSYYMARSLDLNKYASVLCGITFMFSGFMVTHAIHETYINPVTYMPLIFMFYNKSLKTSDLKYILLTGLFMGIVVLCGHPQITFYIFFTFLLFGLYQIFFKFKDNSYKIDTALFKFTAIATVPFVIGVMLGAIQLLPTMTLAELSLRAEMSYEQSLEGSLNYHNLITLFSPHFFGTFNAAKDGILYWGHKQGSQHLFLMSCIYIGLSTLVFGVMGIIALWKKRTIKFLTAVLLLSILFALGDNFIVYKFFYNFVPGFDKFRYITGFAALVLAFSFSILCAYGFDYFINNAKSDKVKIFIKCFAVSVSSFVLLWILYQVGLFENIADAYKNKDVYDNSNIQLLKTVIILLALLGLIILYRKKTILQHIILLLFILISFIDLYIFGAQQNNNPNNPGESYFNRELAYQIKQDYNYEGLYRIKARTKENLFGFDQNQGMLDFLFMIDGYNQLNLKNKFPPFRTNDLMNVAYIAIEDTLNEQIMFTFNESYMPRAWMSYYPLVENSLEKVSKILEDQTFDIKTKVIINQEPEIPIDTNSTNIPVYKVDIKSYEINEITLSVETTENGILVLSEVYYPNWKVFVNGIEKPMLRCHYSLRGVTLEKGNHIVVFKYIDKDFQIGTVITIFTLAIVTCGLIVSRYKKL